MQERTNPESDVATMVMLLDIGVTFREIAERFKLDVKTVELSSAKNPYAMNL